jgi:uncharacterized protein YchJ
MQSMCCFAQTKEGRLLRFLLLWLNPMPAHSARSRFMLFVVASKHYLFNTAKIRQFAVHNCSNSTPDFEGYLFINLKGINHEKIS